MDPERYCHRASSGVALAVSVLALAAPAQNPDTAARSAPSVGSLPIWAYPVNAGTGRGRGITGGGGRSAAAPDEGGPKHVPGSSASYTAERIRDLFDVPDWFPSSHPIMPEVVAHGRRPMVRACGYCHLPNGQGRPENQSVTGLPAGYIIQQMADFKNGVRKSSEPRMGSVNLMVQIAKGATDEEVRAGAEYFSSLQMKSWIRVVETDTVPKTRIAGGMLVLADAGTEPIGQRIIEIPEDLERCELRDSSSGFVAYVPLTSIERGKELATTGGAGRTIRCDICHGHNLKGLGNVPSIAGRSPSQMIRQIIDIQNGTRNGPWTQLMKEAVAKLTIDDTIALGAYLASRTP